MSYKTFNANCIIRLTDGQSFPSKDGNADYEEFKRWIALDPINNVVQDADPLPQESLQELKAAKWEAIKAERSRREDGGYLVGAVWYHSDASSLIKYTTILGAARDGSWPAETVASPAWKDMTGNFAPMTVATLRAIRTAGMVKVAQIYAAAETHREAMEASATPETYDFSAGWPADFIL